MSASKQLKILSVRLPEQEVRRFKSIAARRGVSLQEAVHQALGVWATQQLKVRSEDLDALQGSLSSAIDVQTQRDQERQFELAKDRLKMFGV
jgi:hypothetical protein